LKTGDGITVLYCTIYSVHTSNNIFLKGTSTNVLLLRLIYLEVFLRVNFCSRKHKFAGIASNAALVSAIQQSFANQTQAIQAVAVRIEPQGKAFHFPFLYLSAPVKEQGKAFRFYSFDPKIQVFQAVAVGYNRVWRLVFIHFIQRHSSSKQFFLIQQGVRRFIYIHVTPRHRFSKQLQSRYSRVRRFVFIHLIPRHRSSKQLQNGYNKVRRFVFVHLIQRHRSSKQFFLIQQGK